METDEDWCDTEELHGSRQFPKYNIHEQTSLVDFQVFLKSVDGKLKSDKVASETATYVSKFLKFASPESLVPQWSQLLNRDRMLGFIDKLQRAKLGPEGQISVLNHLDSALSFFQLHILRDHTTNPK